MKLRVALKVFKRVFCDSMETVQLGAPVKMAHELAWMTYRTTTRRAASQVLRKHDIGIAVTSIAEPDLVERVRQLEKKMKSKPLVMRLPNLRTGKIY